MKSIFALEACTCIVMAAAAVSAAMPQPIAHWRMDAVKNGVIADVSGHGRDLAVGADCHLSNLVYGTECTLPSLYMPGTSGSWASFECPAMEDFTLALWICRETGDGPLAPSPNIIPYLTYGLSGMNVQAHLNDTIVEPWFFCGSDGNGPRTCYPKKYLSFDKGIWQQLAITVQTVARNADGSRTGTLTFYVDGELQDTVKDIRFPAPFARAGTAILCNSKKGGERPLFGHLGECRLYDTVLDKRQIADLFFASKKLEITAVAPSHQARADVMWVRPICIEKDRYIGWPTVARIANGDLIAVFSGDRDSHVCPWGKVQMVRSSDGGETWTEPQTIANGPLDDRDAGIVQLPDGELLVSYFTSREYYRLAAMRKRWKKDRPEYFWLLHDAKIPERLKREALGNFCIRSRDNGRTWTTPSRFAINCTAPHGPVLLKDGSLFHFGLHNSPKGASRLAAERSTDGGHTWTVLCEKVAEEKNVESCALLDEPHVLELPSGRIIAMIRINDPRQVMRQTHSDDGGRTWAPVTETPICGLPPHLIHIGGNRVVCVYGRRKGQYGGFGEFACISDDGGMTWDVKNEITLAASHCSDLGYPSTAALPDGTLVTVYYQQRAKGEKPCLMATKWRVTK